MRWGLVSTARINERLIPCIRNSKRSELAAVASRSEERARQYAQEWGIPKAYGSYEALLADREIEVVYISLPNHMHVDWAVRAADAGKHVLCEKPLALTTAEVDRIADAAARNRVIVQEAAMMRYHSQIEWVRDQVASGMIGPIRLGRGSLPLPSNARATRALTLRWAAARYGTLERTVSAGSGPFCRPNHTWCLPHS
jgi:predicted dehydrogenase